MSEPDELQQKLNELRATLAQKRAARALGAQSELQASTAASPLETGRAFSVLDQLETIEYERGLSQLPPIDQAEEQAEEEVVQQVYAHHANVARAPTMAATPKPIDPHAPSPPDEDEWLAFQAALSRPAPL
jgi:hypothetical protein